MSDSGKDGKVDYVQVSDHEKEIDSQDGGHFRPEVKERELPEGHVWTNENTVDRGRSFQVPGNDTSGYVGVSPEYHNYGDPNLKPLLTEQERIALHDAGQFTDDELRQASRDSGGDVVMSTDPTVLARVEDEKSEDEKSEDEKSESDDKSDEAPTLL